MTKEEAIANLKEALKEVDMFRKIYLKQRKVSVECEKRYASLSFAINELEQEPITWIVGKDNCQVAVRNMPIDKMQKICAIIGDEEQQLCENMRDASEEERASTKDYIDSISKPTGLQFDDIYEELDFVQPHKKISVNLQPCEDCISREMAIDAIKNIHPVDTEYHCTLYDEVDVMYVLKDLPSVTPTSDALDKIINKIEQTRDKDKIAEYPYNRCIRIIEEYKGGN